MYTDNVGKICMEYIYSIFLRDSFLEENPFENHRLKLYCLQSEEGIKWSSRGPSIVYMSVKRNSKYPKKRLDHEGSTREWVPCALHLSWTNLLLLRSPLPLPLSCGLASLPVDLSMWTPLPPWTPLLWGKNRNFGLLLDPLPLQSRPVYLRWEMTFQHLESSFSKSKMGDNLK